MAHATDINEMTQLPIDPKQRPRYDEAQLQLYFARIQLPQHYLSSPVFKDPSFASTKEHGLPLLNGLYLHHISSIPFENLELQYSAHKTISLNQDVLYDKFVTRGMNYGRGGRCMENNSFFGTVLRSLGYDVRNCAGRVSRSWSPNKQTRGTQGNTYDCWNHMLNLVKLSGQWYVVDAGMGNMGPQIIYPLQDNYSCVAVPPRKLRIQYRSIPEHYSSSPEHAQKLWCFDVCNDPSKPEAEQKWIPTYCFTETEFLPQDYEMMSWMTSTHPKSFFTYCVMCMKMVLDDKAEKVIGDVMLFNDGVRRTIGGKHDWEESMKTEEDRIRVLREKFGVELTEDEKEGIPAVRRLG